jgi:hypothetical protein
VGDASIIDASVATVPKRYTVAGAQQLIIRTVSATFDGTAAAGSFVPVVQLVDPAGIVTGTYPLGSTLMVGASADVTFFPSVGGGGGGSGATFTSQQTIAVDTPDNNGNAFLVFLSSEGYANISGVLPALPHGSLGTWEGRVQISPTYIGGGTITLICTANATTGAARLRVSTAVVAVSVSEDSAYTNESYVNQTVPGTANQRFDVGYALSTTLAPASTLNVQVTRDGGNVADTCTADVVLFGVVLTYTA